MSGKEDACLCATVLGVIALVVGIAIMITGWGWI